ncbi:chemotaxis protein CheW [Fulvivirga sp. 29W222]|uniref:Chemotaxis protein CheW n=1 Tax=Fulvivirga marina TaxID=2494733 RepID=A0A937FYT1_9BACT|nr:chemotaxis protein CheW [Fulvivirga marina]
MNNESAIESKEYKAGILVKQVPSTLSVYESNIEETVNIIGNTSLERNYIKGIVKKAKRLIILIDTIKVIAEQELQNVHQAAV